MKMRSSRLPCGSCSTSRLLQLAILCGLLISTISSRQAPLDAPSSNQVNPQHVANVCKGPSCTSMFQSQQLHTVPSGPNPVGNSLPGKVLVSKRSPPHPPPPNGQV
uniref:CLV3/ESR-related protein n=1 Tax=Selaginella kraussiana TaxID=81964 RepID=A0A0U2UNL1_9TRAC|nr:CLV3/ESR-related protein [Selaginella kraussiana]